MAYYRNRTTGKVQFHPKSGIGDSLNSDEIEETGKPIKPRTSLAPSKDELKAAKNLLKDQSATPLEVAANEAIVKEGSKTTGKKAGDTKKQEGAQ